MVGKKTNKSAKKRFKVTGRKKLLHRSVHQNHFNAKDTGNETRKKRGPRPLPKQFKKNMAEII